MTTTISKMYIKKVVIQNFKCFEGTFSLSLNEGLNILVGNNEAGKSTILEAIHLALSGLSNGRYIKNDLTQYYFNKEIVNKYLQSLKAGGTQPLPFILIELYLSGDDLAFFEGDGNSIGQKDCGISLKVAFDDKYQPEYENLINSGDVNTIPIEYYDIYWTSFSRSAITSKSIPIKSALIDSSCTRYQSGSDMYISRIVKDFLDSDDIVCISQAHRKMRDSFMNNPAIQTINTKIKGAMDVSKKDVTLSVDLSSKNAWENSLMTYLDDVPFHNIGKGEQCIVKTKLALSHKKSKEANILLLEEPENHLSHTKLNELIHDIKSNDANKQIIISTHSSFVANKLGLGSIILLHNGQSTRLDDLDPGTKSFFEKLAGYDTLRLILCKKAILVEGDSDELVVQKAYMINYNNKLPIEDGIDIISVGTSFLRFLEIAKRINKPVAVVTDNDGDVTALERKYNAYIGTNAVPNIRICYDNIVDTGDFKISAEKLFNYNTLEPKLLKSNNLELLNKIFGTTHTNANDIHKYMHENKTECALRIFDTTEIVNIPQYILDAIN